MSHLTTYHSNVLVNVKKPLLIKAVEDLGLEVSYDIKNIRNTWISEKVDAGLLKNGVPISVGFKFINSGRDVKLEVAGDFFCTGIDQATFIDRLSQNYKKHDVIYQCKNQGWTVNNSDITIDKDTNEIVINASRYVV